MVLWFRVLRVHGFVLYSFSCFGFAVLRYRFGICGFSLRVWDVGFAEFRV